MAEVMLGNELHPDRVIPVEKLYEILNEHGINYSFPAQHEIESNAFAVVRCKDCKHWHEETGWCYHHSHFVGAEGEACHPWESTDWKMFDAEDFCSYGERKTDG